MRHFIDLGGLARTAVGMFIFDSIKRDIRTDITKLPGKVGAFFAIIYSLIALVVLTAIIAFIVAIPGQFIFWGLGLAKRDFDEPDMVSFKYDVEHLGINNPYVQKVYGEYIHRSHFQDFANQYSFWFYAILSYCLMMIIVKTYKFYKYAKKNNLKSGDIEWKNEFIG